MAELKLKDYAIVATDKETGEAYCKVLSALQVQLVNTLLRDETDVIRFTKVHGFELRKKA